MVPEKVDVADRQGDCGRVAGRAIEARRLLGAGGEEESAPCSLDRKGTNRKERTVSRSVRGPGLRDEAAADGRVVVAVSVLRHSSRRGRVTGIGSASAPTAAI